MSDWQAKARELLPEMQEELADCDGMLTLFMSDVRAAAHAAHRSRDDSVLKRLHSFASWCMSQPHKELWNAAGVSFYEHLVDEPASRAAIPDWVMPGTFASVHGLMERRMDAKAHRDLLKAYDGKHGTAFAKRKS